MLREHFHEIVPGEGRSTRATDEVDTNELINWRQRDAGSTIIAKVGVSVGFGRGKHEGRGFSDVVVGQNEFSEDAANRLLRGQGVIRTTAPTPPSSCSRRT